MSPTGQAPAQPAERDARRLLQVERLADLLARMLVDDVRQGLQPRPLDPSGSASAIMGASRARTRRNPRRARSTQGDAP
jgi:hypothetical protein